MTPKLLNYLFLSAGGPILSLDKWPYDPLSCHWAGGPMLGGRAGERASGLAPCALRGIRASVKRYQLP